MRSGRWILLGLVALVGCDPGPASSTIGLKLSGEQIHLWVCRDDLVTGLALFRVHGILSGDSDAEDPEERDDELWRVTAVTGSDNGVFVIGATPPGFIEQRALQPFGDSAHLYLDVDTDDRVDQGVGFQRTELTEDRILNGRGEVLTFEQFRNAPENDDC